MKKESLLDVAGAVGVASIMFGAAQIYPPAAWIVGGCFALLIAVFGAIKWPS